MGWGGYWVKKGKWRFENISKKLSLDTLKDEETNAMMIVVTVSKTLEFW